MDEKMEDIDKEGFESLQLDLDYEFFAPFHFDFCRRETPEEKTEAELWFELVGSDPPSPFVTKLNRKEDVHVENVNTLPKAKDVEHNLSIATCSDIGAGLEFSLLDEKYGETNQGVLLTGSPINNLQIVEHVQQPIPSSDLNTSNDFNIADLLEEDRASKGLPFYSLKVHNVPTTKQKSVSGTSFSKGSTLMKPTASQLAKQNRPREVKVFKRVMQRFEKPMTHKNERDVEKIPNNECQAAKRQKLESGHLRKVIDGKHQINLIHKVPRKALDHNSCTSLGTHGPAPCNNNCFLHAKNVFVDGNSEQAKLKLTIPREPVLETAQRAQRTRPKNTSGLEHTHSTAPKFKARRPLNRKIFEFPSLPLPRKSTPRLPDFQEFHLKTSERAIQHSAAIPSAASGTFKAPTIRKCPVDSKRSHSQAPIPSHLQKSKVFDDPKQEAEKIPKFKALPLNKKIFLSKGDFGVFRNSKREATIPLEFNFPTDKRFPQQNPPIELFSKLSLRSEVQHNVTQTKTCQPILLLPVKGSKENIGDSFQKECQNTNTSVEKLQRVWEKQVLSGMGFTGIESQAKMHSIQDQKFDEQRLPLKEVHGVTIFSVVNIMLSARMVKLLLKEDKKGCNLGVCLDGHVIADGMKIVSSHPRIMFR